MLDPYRMVVINLLFSTLLIIGILIYKFVYPKRKLNLLVLMILISFLPLISIFRKGGYESGDLSIHAQLSMIFFESLKQGSILPRISNLSCYQYSCPDLIFLYLFPYYLVSFLHFLRISFLFSIKIILILSYIFSGIFMFFWIKDELKSEISAFVASIFYLFAPYHLVDMHFRVDLAECICFALLPLAFLITKKFITKVQYKYFLLEAFILAILITTHQVISLAIFPFVISYAIFQWYFKTKKRVLNLIVYFISVFTGLILSLFYWLPIFYEKKYVFWGIHPSTVFPEFKEFIYSPWRYGFLFQGHKGELSFIIGYVQLIILFLSLFYIFKLRNKIKEKKYLVFFVFCFFVAFLSMQSFSKPIYDLVPLIKNFQFSYRILILSSLFISVIAAIIVNLNRNKYFVLIICFLAIGLTILNWGNRKSISVINDSYLFQKLLNADLQGSLVTPKWINREDLWTKTLPKTSIEVINGKANIVNIYRNSTEHEYIINAQTDTVIKENTFYFPGWILKINNKEEKINYWNKYFPGIITFNLNEGLYKVELIFTDTPIRSISEKISLFTFFLLIVIYPLARILKIFKLAKVLNIH